MQVHELPLDTSTKTASGVTEVWQVSLRLPSLESYIYFFTNQLGTDADIVNIAIAGQKLESSPLLHAWSQATMDQFDGHQGLWLTSDGPTVQLITGFGRPSELAGLPGPVEQYESAQYFLIPTDLADKTDLAFSVQLICVN